MKKYHINQCKVIKSNGFVIKRPGYYRLCEDICFTSCDLFTVAITIRCSNVILDFNNYTLTQCPPNNNIATGIKIKENRNNISIIGNTGFITNFNGWGVDFEGPNNNILINGIQVRNCGSDIRIPGTTFSTDGAVRVGQVDTTDKLVSELIIKNVNIIDNKNIGLSIGADNNITIQNILIDNTYSSVPIYQVTGLALRSQNVANPDPRVKNVSITNSVIRKTQCKNVRGFDGVPAYGVIGLYYVGIDNINISGCTASDTVCAADNNDPVGPFIVFANNVVQSGVINSTLENNIFTNCSGDSWCLFTQNFHTSANSAVPNIPTSGLLSSLNHVYKNNITSGASGYSNVAGFAFYYASNILVEDCHSADVKVIGSFSGPPFPPCAIGFTFESAIGVSGGPPPIDNVRGQMNNIIVKNCTSIDNVSEFGRANGFCYAAGYFSKFEIDGITPTPPVNLKDVSFINCVTQKNIAKADNILGAQAAGVGFLIDKGVIANQGNFVGPPLITGYKSPETLENIFITECRASNCHGADNGIPYSGGIVVLAVNKCQISNSSGTDNQNGILLGGGNSYLLNFPLGNTINSLVQSNKEDNNNVGYSDTNGTNAFVDNVAYNNIIQYQNVSNVIINGNRSF